MQLHGYQMHIKNGGGASLSWVFVAIQPLREGVLTHQILIMLLLSSSLNVRGLNNITSYFGTMIAQNVLFSHHAPSSLFLIVDFSNNLTSLEMLMDLQQNLLQCTLCTERSRIRNLRPRIKKIKLCSAEDVNAS